MKSSILAPGETLDIEYWGPGVEVEVRFLEKAAGGTMVSAFARLVWSFFGQCMLI